MFMNRIFKSAAKVAVVIGSGLSAGAAFAADPPTTALALAQSVDMSDAKAAGLAIIGLLIAAGVVLWGARLVLSKFAPRI
jgi:hypothetical protein